jgi:hypothetical protein
MIGREGQTVKSDIRNVFVNQPNTRLPSGEEKVSLVIIFLLASSAILTRLLNHSDFVKKLTSR